jgi:hypothetical protein
MMHSLTLVLTGLIMLAGFVLIANFINRGRSGRPIDGAFWFIWAWLAASLLNFYIGVSVAGYSMAAEIPFLIIVFGVPAGAAWYLSRRFKAKRDADASV